MKIIQFNKIVICLVKFEGKYSFLHRFIQFLWIIKKDKKNIYLWKKVFNKILYVYVSTILEDVNIIELP